MTLERELPLLLWPVACFDRRRKNPLPVYNRWYWLDWSQLTPEQVHEVMAVIDAKNGLESVHKPAGFEESVVTMTIGAPRYDTHMLRYRHLFTEVPHNDIAAFHAESAWRERGFQTVSVALEYFEDETGAPISKNEMMQHVSGHSFPIIVGDPASVMKLGPLSPINTGDWTVEKANVIAQFLDVVQRIHASNWYRAPRSMTSVIRASGGSKLLEARFPSDQDTMSVLAYFRQLHAGDELVAKACDCYLSHASDDRKRWWIKDRQQVFASLVDSPPVPHVTNGHTRRQIVRMFMYGAGLLHSESDHGDDIALDQFVGHHGKHKAVMVFNACLMDFLRVAAAIHLVIQQDFTHWLATDGLAAPTRVGIQDLFEGFTSPPRDT